jgi:hypothetical protein
MLCIGGPYRRCRHAALQKGQLLGTDLVEMRLSAGHVVLRVLPLRFPDHLEGRVVNLLH